MKSIHQVLIVVVSCGVFALAQIVIRGCPYGYKNCPKGHPSSSWQCKQGYVKPERRMRQSELSCTDCPANCINCENATYCIQCDEEFYKVKVAPGSSLCLNCPPGCKNCYKVEKDGTVECNSCKQGFKMTEGECRECPSNCKSCINEWCDACGEGFFRGERECDGCPTGCKECLNATVCQTCYEGYFLDPETDQCEDCPSNCKTCNSQEECNECNEGFVLREDKECYECPLNCKRCNGNRDCLDCEDGFFIKENFICRDMCYRCGAEDNFRSDCGIDASNASYVEEECPHGNCWVQRMQDGDDVTFFRGCREESCPQEFLSESCQNINENKTICSKCCWGPRCNSFTLKGRDAGVTLVTSPLLLLTSGLLHLLLGSAS